MLLHRLFHIPEFRLGLLWELHASITLAGRRASQPVVRQRSPPAPPEGTLTE